MGKLTAYQKLKAENERLKQELMILANMNSSVSAALIKRKYQFLQEVENEIMKGSPNDRMEYKGIIPQIK